MSRKRVVIVTVGVMFSLFMAAVETTVIATAMPTIVSYLGGLASYSWAFSAYMLASTTTVPLYGKLSDLYGRRPIFLLAMILFLAGSILCGRAESMGQLIAFRAVQGLGAGGLMPLAFIIIGDIFSFEQRARVQGLFSGVWGVSSVIGPLLGGFLVDQVSWRWVFYVNVIPGLLSAFLVWKFLPGVARRTGAEKVHVDYAGAGLLTAGVVALLLGLNELGATLSWLLLALAVALFVALVVVERRAGDPVLPLSLFRNRLFAVACGQGVLVGWAMFGSTSYVPLFVQSVLGTSATIAGSALTPMLLSWVVASIIGSRLLLQVGYRSLLIGGMVALTVGAFFMSQVSAGISLAAVMLSLALMGVGMGFVMPIFMIAVQSSVPRAVLGTATATLQFSRSIGGTLGVSVMGAALSMRLASSLLAAGRDPSSISLNGLTDTVSGGGASVAVDNVLRLALADGTRSVFIIAFGAAFLGLLVTTLTPRGLVRQREEAAEPGPVGPGRMAAQPVEVDERPVWNVPGKYQK